jgi:hypothetical protein
LTRRCYRAPIPASEGGRAIVVAAATGARWRAPPVVHRTDRDAVWVDAEIPADIAVKFADAALFVQHP